MQRVAQDWLVLTKLSDESGLAVGIVTALQFLPMLFLSPMAGLLADRLPRRKLLIFTQSSLGVLAAGLGALVIFDVAQDRKSTRLNSSHVAISYAVVC